MIHNSNQDPPSLPPSYLHRHRVAQEALPDAILNAQELADLEVTLDTP